MAAVRWTACAQQLQCSICLEVFTDPVTTPCGHTFCRVCINQHWNNNSPYNCPLCKHKFSSRPDLQINLVLARIVYEYKNGPKMTDGEVEIVSLELWSAASGEIGHDVPLAPGEVGCDVCLEPKLKAQKSCPVCVASYCPNHLQPHLSDPQLVTHPLIEPMNVRALLTRQRKRVIILLLILLSLSAVIALIYLCISFLETAHGEIGGRGSGGGRG